MASCIRQDCLTCSQHASVEGKTQPGHPPLPGLHEISRNLGEFELTPSYPTRAGMLRGSFQPFPACGRVEDPLMVVGTQGTSLQGVFKCKQSLPASPRLLSPGRGISWEGAVNMTNSTCIQKETRLLLRPDAGW